MRVHYFGVCMCVSEEGGTWKTNILVGYTLKGELGKFADLRGLAEKKRVVFLRGVDTLMHTMVCIKAIFKYAKSYSELEKLLKSLSETCKDYLH